MIDWLGVLFGALWVAGLSLAVVVASFAGWVARQQGQRLRQVLAGKGYVVPIEAGGVLFALGMVYGGRPWWEVALWLLVAAAFAYDAVATYRRPG